MHHIPIRLLLSTDSNDSESVQFAITCHDICVYASRRFLLHRNGPHLNTNSTLPCRWYKQPKEKEKKMEEVKTGYLYYAYSWNERQIYLPLNTATRLSKCVAHLRFSVIALLTSCIVQCAFTCQRSHGPPECVQPRYPWRYAVRDVEYKRFTQNPLMFHLLQQIEAWLFRVYFNPLFYFYVRTCW